MPTLVAMADTHGFHRDLRVPDGDILIHAGDLTQRGTLAELEEAATFLRSLPHRHKVVIAGNHDFGFQQQPTRARALFDGLTYLEDEAATLDGLTIWGSPWQPWFYDWAFNLPRGTALDAKWRMIPPRIDILITHGPPAGYGDRVHRGERVGCEDLLRHVKRVQPKYHFFGHIHEDTGRWTLNTTTLVNCSTSEAELPCTVFHLETKKRVTSD